jgi:hypothetical protein
MGLDAEVKRLDVFTGRVFLIALSIEFPGAPLAWRSQLFAAREGPKDHGMHITAVRDNMR